nr:hypothetical protein [Eubacterium sp.]
MKLSKCIGKVLKKASIIGSAAFLFAASPAVTANAEGERPEADPSKGVTYDINEVTGVVNNYNCNGNSVIITTVKVDGTDYLNIYIDKDADGEIDEDESPVELPSATSPDSSEKSPNLETGYVIYGAVSSKVTNPFTITVMDSQSGINKGIYGTVSSEVLADITLNVKNVTSNYDIAALYGGTTQTGNVTVNVEESTLGSLYGVSNGCTLSGEVNVDISTTNVKNVYGIYGGSTCNGDVSVTVDEYSGSYSS